MHPCMAAAAASSASPQQRTLTPSMMVAPMPITTQSSMVAACTVAPGPMVTRLPITVGSACGSTARQGQLCSGCLLAWAAVHSQACPATAQVRSALPASTQPLGCRQRSGTDACTSSWAGANAAAQVLARAAGMRTLPAALCLATWISTLSCTLVFSPIDTLLTSPAAQRRAGRQARVRQRLSRGSAAAQQGRPAAGA